MKLSIIIPVLNSHEIVRRQLLHFHRIGLPRDVELLLVDDGSDPPISGALAWQSMQLPLRVIATNDYRPWTWALARNRGAKEARGDYFLMVDLDYILSRDAIDAARHFTGDKMRFRRQFGILDEQGRFTQDVPMLLAYGLSPERVQRKGVSLPPHPNNFAIRRDVYWQLGGYREDLIHRPYPQGEDRHFKRAWMQLVAQGKVKDHDERPMIYMFPNGQWCGDVDHNPFGLFHGLSRKTSENPWHKKLEDGHGR